MKSRNRREEGEEEIEKAGRAIAIGLAIWAGFYVLYKLLTSPRGAEIYICPNCHHRVSYRAPYCWYCRIPLHWESSPPRVRMPAWVTLFIVGILAFLVTLRFAVYPFAPGTVEACEKAIWFFGGMFGREFLGYYGRAAS